MSTRTQGEFAWHLGAGLGSIAAARHAFQSWLHEARASAEEIDDLSVVLSELASNAIDGSDPGDARADLRAVLDGSEVRLEVTNEVPPQQADVLRWDLDDPLRGGGRGLMIVRAYTDTMVVDSADGSVTVRCTRRLTTEA